MVQPLAEKPLGGSYSALGRVGGRREDGLFAMGCEAGDKQGQGWSTQGNISTGVEEPKCWVCMKIQAGQGGLGRGSNAVQRTFPRKLLAQRWHPKK